MRALPRAVGRFWALMVRGFRLRRFPRCRALGHGQAVILSLLVAEMRAFLLARGSACVLPPPSCRPVIAIANGRRRDSGLQFSRRLVYGIGWTGRV